TPLRPVRPGPADGRLARPRVRPLLSAGRQLGRVLRRPLRPARLRPLGVPAADGAGSGHRPERHLAPARRVLGTRRPLGRLLMALAMGIDWMVISRQAASFWDHYCVSAAYWGLVPAYGLLWAGGSWLRGRYTGASAAQAGRLLGAFLVAVVACQFIAQGTFYWYSGVVAEPTIAGWWKNFLDWLPGYMGTAAAYTAIATALQVTAERVAPALRL